MKPNIASLIAHNLQFFFFWETLQKRRENQIAITNDEGIGDWNCLFLKTKSMISPSPEKLLKMAFN